MLEEIVAVIHSMGVTVMKILPWTIGLGLAFAVLSVFWPCNAGKPWWRKRDLVTDICYWFVIPLFARYLRIGLLVLGAAWLFGINTAQGLVEFYDDGHGPLAQLPLWLQAVIFLVASDFMLYWIHRAFHRPAMWKYHAVHHSSEELDWISAARFHPVNIFLGSVPSTSCCCSPASRRTCWSSSGRSRSCIPPSCTPISTGRSVRSNTCWQGPVFHRWHHTAAAARRREEFRRHLSGARSDVRHLLHAEGPGAGVLWRGRSDAADLRRARCSIRSGGERVRSLRVHSPFSSLVAGRCLPIRRPLLAGRGVRCGRVNDVVAVRRGVVALCALAIAACGLPAGALPPPISTSCSTRPSW